MTVSAIFAGLNATRALPRLIGWPMFKRQPCTPTLQSVQHASYPTPYHPLHIRGNAANFEDRTIRVFFYMKIYLNSQRENFFCFVLQIAWLHSHDVQGVYIVNFEPPKLFRISFKEFPFPSEADNNNNNTVTQ